MQGLQSKYEDHHNVKYDEKAIKACVYLSNRYISDKFLPDKAIDLMDEAGSRAHMLNMKVPKEITDLESKIEKIHDKKDSAIISQKFEDAANLRDSEQKLLSELNKVQNNWKIDEQTNPIQVNEDDISEVVSMVTRIPISKVAESERQKLLNMKKELSEKIIGQNRAVESISKAIQRARSGLKRKHRPIGVFLLLGPTGIGKTETAKVLSKYLFSHNDSLIKLDMSEYGERFSISRLIGAPPGYVGYEEGGELTEKVRRNPYSLILFDEIEKAHPDVFNTLLQLFDEGVLTDGIGRKVDFRNTIIILTSNIGTKEIQGAADFGFTKTSSNDSYDAMKSLILDRVKDTFNPEFINRLDETIVYNALSKNDVLKIIDLQLLGLRENLTKLGLGLTISKKAKEFLINKGFNQEYGVRHLNREIQNLLEDPLSELLLGKTFVDSTGVKVDLKSNKISILPILKKTRPKVVKKTDKKVNP